MSSLQNLDVTSDTLILDGDAFPPTGETEKFRIAFPATREVGQANNGADVVSKIPVNGADLTVTCLTNDPGNAILRRLYAKQEAGTQLGAGGAGMARFNGQADADAARWELMTILKQADMVSATGRPTVTWTIRLHGVVRL